MLLFGAVVYVGVPTMERLHKKFFRRDQIWFVQKDEFGYSELCALSDFKIRSDASFEKDYLSGKYGAIPIVGDLTRLFNTQEK